MVSFFWGELLFHPAAINIDLNTCAHRCCYCYANARRSARRSNLNEVRRLCAGEMKGAAGQAWEMGYPVTLCNNTDPLSPNNAREALSVVRMVNRENRPLYIMTKGGRREDEDELIRLLAENGHAMLYVSISAANDEISAKTEPGARPISARLDLLRRARAAGVAVKVGFNPFHAPWWPGDTHDRMQDALLAEGIDTWFYNKLHLSRWQVEDPRCTAVLATDEIRAIRRSGHYWDMEEYRRRVVAAIDKGAAVYEIGLPTGRTAYFDNIRAALGKPMPATGEFVCEAVRRWRAQSQRREDCKPMEFRLTDFIEVIGRGRSDLFGMDARFAEWFLLHDMKAFSTPRIKRMRSFRDFLREVWNNPRLKQMTPRGNIRLGVRDKRDENGDAILFIDDKWHGVERR